MLSRSLDPTLKLTAEIIFNRVYKRTYYHCSKYSNMKKIFFFVLGILCLASCIRSGPQTTTSMNIHDESGTIKIRSSGKVRFNREASAISSISPYGYLEYSHKRKRMRAEADAEGNVSYFLKDGSERLQMNESGRRFLASVIQDVVRRGFKN